MKIYLDDVRDTPSGWVRAYWPEEAINYLKTGEVTEISLDHDLGEEGIVARTGKDVLLWIFDAVINDNFIPPIMHVHSDNGPEIYMMNKTIEAINRWYKELNNVETKVVE